MQQKEEMTSALRVFLVEAIDSVTRLFDEFSLSAGRLCLIHQGGKDWLIEEGEPVRGTRVRLRINLHSTQTPREIFDRYATEQDDYAFSRTHVVVHLARSGGEQLVSRSQAKRIMARLDRFREVVLDFDHVEDVGPAFADEIFRVFAIEHPSVRLTVTNVTLEVSKMIKRARAHRAQ